MVNSEARLRPELRAVVDALLASTKTTREVTLDAIGEALGIRAVSPPEIEMILAVLETEGRTIVTPQGGRGEERLKSVVTAARALASELGRAAKVDEIAARSGLTTDEVRHALALAKVLQR